MMRPLGCHVGAEESSLSARNPGKIPDNTLTQFPSGPDISHTRKSPSLPHVTNRGRPGLQVAARTPRVCPVSSVILRGSAALTTRTRSSSEQTATRGDSAARSSAAQRTGSASRRTICTSWVGSRGSSLREVCWYKRTAPSADAVTRYFWFTSTHVIASMASSMTMGATSVSSASEGSKRTSWSSPAVMRRLANVNTEGTYLS